MEKLKKYKYIILIIPFIFFIVLFASSNRVKVLNAPEVKKISNLVSGNVAVSGIAYPNARVSAYVDGNFVKDIPVDSTGNFLDTVTLTEEGQYKISFKQTKKNIVSPLSHEQEFQVDLTPPNKNDFKLNTDLPTSSKEGSVKISVSGPKGSFVNVSGINYEIKENSNFDIDYKLQSGNNVLSFKLVDAVGNSTEEIIKKTIVVDFTPPKIDTGFCGFALPVLQESEEYVCVNLDSWQGYLDSTNSVPITGLVKGEIKSITIDGKQIRWDENNEIYQRINLYIHGGLNKYKVIVEDISGNKSTGYVETDAQRNNETIDLNINE